jgi:hypothetical protein
MENMDGLMREILDKCMSMFEVFRDWNRAASLRTIKVEVIKLEGIYWQNNTGSFVKC